MIVRKTIRLEDDVIKKLEVKHGDFKTGITIAAEKEVGVYGVSKDSNPEDILGEIITGLPKKPVHTLKEAVALSEEIFPSTPQVEPKECTIESPGFDIDDTKQVFVTGFSGLIAPSVSDHQLNILSWMFPTTKKDSTNLINVLLDHLIPDTSKANIDPYDEDGKLIKKYESKTPLDEDCSRWKKNLRAMQCVDRMQDLQKVSPPPPSVKRGK